jgi:hypothetical protein
MKPTIFAALPSMGQQEKSGCQQLLSFGNKIKKVVFCFAFRSLIRNFATKNTE